MGRTIFALSGVGKSAIRSHIRHTTTTVTDTHNASNVFNSTTPENLFMEDKIPSSFWEEKDNQKKFAEFAAKKLQIREMDDWYKVTRNVITALNSLIL